MQNISDAHADQLRRGYELIKQGEHERGELLLTELLDSGGDTRSEAAYLLGVSAAHRGNYESAFKHLDMVSDRNRHSAEALYYKAAISWKRKEPWNARHWCLLALAKAPEHEAALDLKRQIDQHLSGQHEQAPSSRGTAPDQLNPRPPKDQGRSRPAPLTDLSLPDDEIDLAEYKSKKLAKERANLMIETVHKYPWYANIFRFGVAALGICFAIYIGGMLVGIFPGASKAWCMGLYEMYQKDPKFYGRSTLEQLREARCDWYGIPPK